MPKARSVVCVCNFEAPQPTRQRMSELGAKNINMRGIAQLAGHRAIGGRRGVLTEM